MLLSRIFTPLVPFLSGIFQIEFLIFSLVSGSMYMGLYFCGTDLFYLTYNSYKFPLFRLRFYLSKIEDEMSNKKSFFYRAKNVKISRNKF